MLNMNELRQLAVKVAAEGVPYPEGTVGYGTQNQKEHPANVVDDYADIEGVRNRRNLEETATGKAKERGNYLRASGVGAGAGALAGIPLALLAHALMAGKEKRGLRDYLKSGLLGALLGGGVGAAGGFGLRKYMMSNPGELEGMLEGAKTDTYLAPDSMRNLAALKDPSLRFNRISPESLEAANEGRLSIPGVTADYFGLGPREADTFSNSALNKVLAGLNFLKGD